MVCDTLSKSSDMSMAQEGEGKSDGQTSNQESETGYLRVIKCEKKASNISGKVSE